jgi:hypothetical protein
MRPDMADAPLAGQIGRSVIAMRSALPSLGGLGLMIALGGCAGVETYPPDYIECNRLVGAAEEQPTNAELVATVRELDFQTDELRQRQADLIDVAADGTNREILEFITLVFDACMPILTDGD